VAFSSLRNQSNPNFAQVVPLDYWFEKAQKLRFEVYDVDKPNGSLSRQDNVGEAVINLGDILGSPGGVATRDLKYTASPLLTCPDDSRRLMRSCT
jgi:hypothetical protein